MIWLIILCGLLSLVYGAVTIKDLMAADAGSARMQEIAGAVAEGAQAYLKRQYLTIGIVGVVIGILLFLLLGGKTAIGFVIGAVLSGLAGFIGMNVSVRANVRTAQAATVSLAGGLDIAFKAGAVTGMLVAGLALLGVACYFYVLTGPLGLAFNDRETIDSLVALGFGASLISIFARLGGGIFTKGADVGADLVGKVEAGIPGRRPTQPRDHRGQRRRQRRRLRGHGGRPVRDLCGDGGRHHGARLDLLRGQGHARRLPCCIRWRSAPPASSPRSSGAYFVKLGANNSIMGALYKGLIVTGALSVVGLAMATNFVFGWGSIGEVAGQSGHRRRTCSSAAWSAWRSPAPIVYITEYYTGTGKRPVVSIAQASVTGHGTNVIQGLAVSLESTAMPALVIVSGIIATYQLAGLFGTAIAVTTMLGLAGMIVALDAFGPVTDNAGGIAEMAGLPKEVRQSTDALDAVGNTTKAVTKGYAIGSAGLGALVLFAAYTNDLNAFIEQGLPYFKDIGHVYFDLSNPYVVAGLIFGGLIPYLFGGIAMTAVGRAAGSVVEEVRRQFKEKPGIMDGTRAPRLRPRRGHADQGRDQGNDHPVAAAGAGAAGGLFRRAADFRQQGFGLRRARRLAARRDRQRPVRRHFDDLGRRRLGQRQEEL